MGRYFDIIDVDQDGKAELISYGRETAGAARVLTVYFNAGSTQTPQWRPVVVTTPPGNPIPAPNDVNDAPRLSVGDWNHDGKPDLIIGIEHKNKTVPPELPTLGGSRMAGFRNPDVYDPYTGEIHILLNTTQVTGKPIFAPPLRLEADGEAISTYINPYPTGIC